MEARARRLGKLVHVLIWALVLIGLYLSSHYSYLLFHSLAELFSVVIAVGVFAIAWNSRRFLENNYLLFLGIAYLFVGVTDLVHALAYKGMEVFPGYGANLPTQLWIAARYQEAVALLLAPWFLNRRLHPVAAFAGYFLAFTLLLLAIFYWRIFPVCFVEGVGLTPFKKISEYVICVALLGALAFLWRERAEFDQEVFRLLVWSIVLTIGSELAFTFYVNVYGLFNLIGHIFKILSFYLIYKALIETGLVKPYNLLFRNLKLSEEALRKERDLIFKLNTELELRVREVTRQRAELEAANRELESFSYSVSHDLRAPLRGISGFCRALEEDYGAGLAPQGLDYLHKVQDSSRQMAELIDALLGLSRMLRAELHPSKVDLSSLARAVAADLQKAAPGRQVDFIIEPKLSVYADRAMVRAVLQNLLSNAWKFTGQVPRARIEFGALPQPQGGPVFFVRDNGAGFDMKYADKLFAAFQRLHSSREFPGTGIGLATVQRIVQRHGGRVWAEAEVNQGATFYFTLEGQPENEVI
jgi:signal transduction histidine kinase